MEHRPGSIIRGASSGELYPWSVNRGASRGEGYPKSITRGASHGSNAHVASPWQHCPVSVPRGASPRKHQLESINTRAGSLDRPRRSEWKHAQDVRHQRPPGSNWSLPGCRPGIRRGPWSVLLGHPFVGQQKLTPSPPKDRMIFVLRASDEGHVCEVVGHQLEDVEDREDKTTPSPCHRRRRQSEPGRYVDVLAVDKNVDGDDHLCCTCYTRTPSWIEVFAAYL